MVKQPWACKKTEDLPILISYLFHFFHQLYSTRLVCCLIGTTWCQQGLVLRRWTFQASRSSRWHSWQRITKLLRSICTRWRKRTGASLCFLLHIAIFCVPLYLREYDQYISVLLCYNCPTTIYRDLYIVPPLLNFITERRGCCAGVRSSRTLVRDSQRPLWFLVPTYRHKLLYLAFHLVSYSLLAFFCSNVATIKVLRDAFLFRNLWARHCSRCQGNQSHERGASKAWRRACFEVARLQGSDKLMSWISWMFHSTLLFWRFYH